MTKQEVIETYFMEHRAKLLDLAAFLDRFDRAQDVAGVDSEFRIAAFRSALEILSDGNENRVQRLLDHFSDPTEEPLESAAGLKGAHGAWSGK
jgi:hypothetical protein